MNIATTATRHGEQTRLLVFPARDRFEHATVRELEAYVHPGDVLVVNRSATLPSSFRGHLTGSGEFVELRLAAFQGADARQLEHWLAVAFGAGDWRQPTEAWGPAPVIENGDVLWFGPDLQARVNQVWQGRLLDIHFLSPALLPNLYRHGKPIQYAYHDAELALWDQQTLFSGPPISAEPPSASLSKCAKRSRSS